MRLWTVRRSALGRHSMRTRRSCSNRCSCPAAANKVGTLRNHVAVLGRLHRTHPRAAQDGPDARHQLARVGQQVDGQVAAAAQFLAERKAVRARSTCQSASADAISRPLAATVTRRSWSSSRVLVRRRISMSSSTIRMRGTLSIEPLPTRRRAAPRRLAPVLRSRVPAFNPARRSAQSPWPTPRRQCRWSRSPPRGGCCARP